MTLDDLTCGSVADAHLGEQAQLAETGATQSASDLLPQI